MTHGSLFSGIGGFDLSAEWMGWENKFHCEINPFCQKVLKYHFPESVSYADIKTTDFSVWRGRIDVVTGGFPCQPFSHAGKRKGTEDDRYLWKEMLRAIREIQPGWIVGENVFGIVNWSGGMVFDEVQASLEAEGYEVQPFILPACGVNAPHKRERVWFVAYKSGERLEGSARTGVQGESTRFAECGNGNATNTYSNGFNGSNSEHEINTGEGREYAQRDIEPVCSDVTNSCDKGLQGSEKQGSLRSILQDGNEQFAGLLQPGWEEFPTQPPLCSRNDGLSFKLDGITFPKWRNESIKGYGNAIVPQVAFQLFKAIEEYEK